MSAERSAVALDRLQLGGAAILSPTRAAELLPTRESEALRWLRDRGLVRSVPGLGDVVVWGEVISAILRDDGPDATTPESDVTPRTRLKRVRL